MRTTIELPDPVLRQVKARAALEGVTLKQLIASFVEQGLRQTTSSTTSAPRLRSPLPVLPQAATGKPIRALSAGDVAKFELQEDLEKHERSTRR